MRFKAGYLGLAVVMVALFGSILSGLIFNVDKVQTVTTGYDYVTDITGLFDVSEDPQYIDYNPASNYTGYTNTISSNAFPSGISFIESSIANNYRIPTSMGEVVVGPSGTLDNNSSFISPAEYSSEIYAFNDCRPADRSGYAILYSKLTNFKAVTVYDWAVATFGDLSQYVEIEINFNSPSPSYPAVGGTTMTKTLSPQVGNTTLSKITINVANLTCTAVNSNGAPYYTDASLYDAILYYGGATQSTEYWSLNGSQILTDSTVLSLPYTSTLTKAPTYAYMLPSGGVTLAGNPNGGYFSTIWNNDTTTQYDNAIVNIVVQFTSNDILLIDNHWISKSFVGDFPAVMVSFNGLTGKVNLFPITSFTNFNEFTVSDTAISSLDHTVGIIDSLTFSKLSNTLEPLRWSVYSTTLFMDTYDTVMVDPSIDLANYWPDMESYRYWFQSVALYGESVTINGQTFMLDDNESITIDYFPERLTNFYISYGVDNHAYITFNQSMRTYDLGEITDKVLSFTGIWYFNVGLYEGHETVKDVYEWAGAFEGSANMVIILALGLIVVGTLVAKRMGYSFKMWDKIVLIICGFALLCLIGGFV